MRSKLFELIILTTLLVGCGVSENRKEQETPKTASTSHVIMLSEREVQMANVKVGFPETGVVQSTISASGKIVPKPAGSSVVASRFGGRVRKLLVREPGTMVRSGQAVAILYSPELQGLLREYRLAAAQPAQDLKNASMRRLNNLGFNEKEINEMVQQNEIPTEFPIKSTASGLVSKVSLSEGGYVEAGTPIIRFESSTGFWAEIELYSSDMKYLDNETAVKIYHQGTNELIGEGRLMDLIQETGSSQNLRYLVELANNKITLAPGTNISAILSKKVTENFTLPVESVIRAGTKSYVFLEKEKLAFELRAVQTGTGTPDRITITGGLEKTDRVVTSGAYLLQSAYRLRFGELP